MTDKSALTQVKKTNKAHFDVSGMSHDLKICIQHSAEGIYLFIFNFLLYYTKFIFCKHGWFLVVRCLKCIGTPQTPDRSSMALYTKQSPILPQRTC